MSIWYASFRRACAPRKGLTPFSLDMITTGALAVGANRDFAEGLTATILALPVKKWLSIMQMKSDGVPFEQLRLQFSIAK